MANSLEGMAMHDFNDPDFRRLIELTNQTYSGQEIADANYLTWEYHLNPDGQSIILFLNISFFQEPIKSEMRK